MIRQVFFVKNLSIDDVLSEWADILLVILPVAYILLFLLFLMCQMMYSSYIEDTSKLRNDIDLKEKKIMRLYEKLALLERDDEDWGNVDDMFVVDKL